MDEVFAQTTLDNNSVDAQINMTFDDRLEMFMKGLISSLGAVLQAYR